MAAIPTCIRTIPATPVRPAYDALCADLPGPARPIVLFNGRPCYVESETRVRTKKVWGFHNRIIVRYVDDGSAESVSAGQFGKGAKRAA